MHRLTYIIKYYETMYRALGQRVVGSHVGTFYRDVLHIVLTRCNHGYMLP